MDIKQQHESLSNEDLKNITGDRNIGNDGELSERESKRKMFKDKNFETFSQRLKREFREKNLK